MDKREEGKGRVTLVTGGSILDWEPGWKRLESPSARRSLPLASLSTAAVDGAPQATVC